MNIRLILGVFAWALGGLTALAVFYGTVFQVIASFGLFAFNVTVWSHYDKE